jgi:NitT/TauT family transport system substrate-binding protein
MRDVGWKDDRPFLSQQERNMVEFVQKARRRESSRRKFLSALGALPVAAAFPRRVLAQASSGTLKIGLHKAMIYTPAILVRDRLKNLKVELVYFSAPSDVVTALVSNSIDVAYTGLTIAAIARSKGQPITVVANAGEKGSAIMVRSENPAKSLADLKGKKIGTQPGGIQDVLLREELKKANLGPNDVELLRLTYAEMPLTLARGGVDAYSGNEPSSTQAVRDGYARVLAYPYDNPVGGINGGILTTDSAVSGRADMVQEMVAAHAKAANDLQADPAEWASVASKEWGFDKETLKLAAPNVSLRWQMDDAFKKSYVAYMTRLQEISLLGSLPDLSKLVNTEFVSKLTF